MAGIGTILGGLLGGYAQGKRANADAVSRHQEFEQQNDQAQQELEMRRTAASEQHDLEQARLDMERNAARVALRNQGVDPDTGQPLPVTKLTGDATHLIPHNHGVLDPSNPQNHTPSPQLQAQLLYRQAAQLIATGLPQDRLAAQDKLALAKGLMDSVKTDATAGLDASRSALINNGQIPELQARADMDRAHATYYTQAHDYALRIAQGHDAAAFARAKMEMLARKDIANIQDGSRESVAEIAGAYRLRGLSAEQAAQNARATYNNQFRDYLQRTNPQNTLLNPGGASAPEPVLTAPTINYNFTPPAFPGQPPAAPGQPSAANPNNSPTPPNRNATNGSALSADDRATIAASVSDGRTRIAGNPAAATALRAQLDGLIASQPAKAAMYREIERQLFGSAHAPVAPLAPRAGGQPIDQLGLPPPGGSNAASPF